MTVNEAVAVPVAEDVAIAVIRGVPYTQMPSDLYIPPDALEVILEAFAGPLDLLLYLIRRDNIDILDIPIAEITRQYMRYVEMMKDVRLELAAEYLVMAAMLAEIKSRMLLPRSPDAASEESDPRADLVRRLLEYERFRQAAQDLDTLPRMERDLWGVSAEPPPGPEDRPLPQVSLRELLFALKDVLARAALYSRHHVQLEPLSVRERMTRVLMRIDGGGFVAFTELLVAEEGRRGVVVTFLAILELIKESLLELVQNELYGPIYVRSPQHVHESGPAQKSARTDHGGESADERIPSGRGIDEYSVT